jgi:hypothetical protein
MSLDPEVEKAIIEATKELGQSERVEKQLIQWLKRLSESQLTVKEKERNLEHLISAIKWNNSK